MLLASLFFPDKFILVPYPFHRNKYNECLVLKSQGFEPYSVLEDGLGLGEQCCTRVAGSVVIVDDPGTQ